LNERGPGTPHWFLTTFGLLGTGALWCWWRIRGLGDVRVHLGEFYVYFAAAFALYLFALWLIGRSERTLQHSRQTKLVVGVIVVVAVLARLILLGTTPTLSDDVYRYRWDGRVQQAGLDPYAYPPDHPALTSLRDAEFARINFPHLRTVYPPLTQLAFRLGVAIGPTLTVQKVVFVTAELLTLLSLLFILWRRERALAWVAAYAWHPLAILEVAGSGHNDVIGLALLWLGLAAWEARRWPGAALSWSAAFLSKFISVILWPWWWFRRHERRWLVVCVLISAAPLVLHLSVLRALHESLSAMTTRFESNASLYLLCVWLTGNAGLARYLVTGAWALFLLWWSWRQADPVKYLLGALGAAALLSPVLHPWYLIWLIPCFCFWRVPALMALTGTVVLAYTVWPGRLTDGRWVIPLWAHVLEYVPVMVLVLWECWRLLARGRFASSLHRPQRGRCSLDEIFHSPRRWRGTVPAQNFDVPLIDPLATHHPINTVQDRTGSNR